jgi:hypothetical protein
VACHWDLVEWVELVFPKLLFFALVVGLEPSVVWVVEQLTVKALQQHLEQGGARVYLMVVVVGHWH